MATDTNQRDPQTYAIIGAAMEVHTELGSGFLEAAYQDALELEFIARKIPYVREQPITIAPSFRAAITMNQDVSTFGIPDYTP